MMIFSDLRGRLLGARDARAAVVARLTSGGGRKAGGGESRESSIRSSSDGGQAQAAGRGSQVAASRTPPAACLLFLSLNIPGPDKNRPACDSLFAAARTALLAALPGARIVEGGRDALGPWLAAASDMDAFEAKRRTVALEESLPAGRLVDLDVYGPESAQVDRRCLGLPPRRCLVCDDEAGVCMRLRRHSLGELSGGVERLLESAR